MDPATLLEIVRSLAFVAGAATIAAYCLLFLAGEDAGFKRRWHFRYLALALVAYAAFGMAIESLKAGSPFALFMLIFLVPGALLFAAFFSSQVGFCDGCGTMAFRTWYYRSNFCTNCGARLERGPGGKDDFASNGDRGDDPA
jgi:hypothetical protein